MRSALALAVVVHLLACSSPIGGAVHTAPLVRLIVDGRAYDSKVVVTEGFAAIDHPGPALFLTKGSARHGLRANSILIDLTDLRDEPDRYQKYMDLLDRNWVFLRGRFNYVAGSEVAGFLTEVDSVMVLRDRFSEQGPPTSGTP